MANKTTINDVMLMQVELLQKQLAASEAREASHLRFIEEQTKTIKSLNETINSLQENISSLQATIDELNLSKAGLEETINELRRMLFGTKSEKSKGSGVASKNPLDDDAPDTSDNTDASDKNQEEASTTYTVKEHTATRKPKSSRNDLYKDLPANDILIQAKDCACPYCTRTMNHIGYKYMRNELQIEPAKIFNVRIMAEMLKCPYCGVETDENTITLAETPKSLFPHSPASPSMVADLMYKKSKDYLTFYRMEADYKQFGAIIPRETLANWFIMGSEEYFAPLYTAMHDEMLTRSVLHADETTCQVLREEGKAPESTSYMWIFTTANDGLSPIVLYKYAAGRAGENAKEFLAGFTGMLQCDGYAGYNKVEDVTLVICVAHLRRKFFEAIPVKDRKKIKLLDVNSEEAIKEPIIPDSTATMSPAVIGVAYCNKLFYIERCIKDKTPEERKAERDKLASPVWEAFWNFVDSLNPVGGSKLEKAVKYAHNHKEGFMNYMLDGQCDLSNNAAERKCKNYALIRRNSLFHTSVRGAEASAIISSIVETAAANNLNVFQYLYTVLLYMPDYKNEPAGIKALLPWSPFIKEHCSGLRDTETMTAENHPELIF